MKKIHKGGTGIKAGIYGVILAAGMAVITGCGINDATVSKTSYAKDSLWKNEKWDSTYTEQSSILTEIDSPQTEQKTVSVVGSVPYFKDDAGQNTQTVDAISMVIGATAFADMIWKPWRKRCCMKRHLPRTAISVSGGITFILWRFPT